VLLISSLANAPISLMASAIAAGPDDNSDTINSMWGVRSRVWLYLQEF
jgi:hypothetical protein